jgi:bud site selection protein 31
MPAIRHASKRKAPPDGFSDLEDDLLIFSNKMKDAQNAPTDNIPKHQAQWPIFQISHQRSRYIYELYYEKEAISKQLYDWLLKNGYADAMLIAKWKKQGYEKVSTLASKSPSSTKGTDILLLKLCCLRCVQTKETNFNSTCICRVPKADLKGKQEIECVSCGCRGCSSSD